MYDIADGNVSKYESATEPLRQCMKPRPSQEVFADSYALPPMTDETYIVQRQP
jgi:hypothetical protein